MRGRADLGRGNVERDLDYNDEQDVEQPLLRLPDVPVADEKSGPGSDDSHDAAGRADQLCGLDDFQKCERDDAGGRSDSRDQITSCESQTADDSFQRRSEDIQREQIKSQVEQVVMEKQGGDESPELSLADDRRRIERAKTMQGRRICQRAAPEFESKCYDIDCNEEHHRGRGFEARLSILSLTLELKLISRAVTRLQGSKDMKLIANLRGRMEKLKRARHFRG